MLVGLTFVKLPLVRAAGVANAERACTEQRRQRHGLGQRRGATSLCSTVLSSSAAKAGMRCMAFLLFFLPRAHFVKPPPHIVFILVDDLGNLVFLNLPLNAAAAGLSHT
ncbi:hypothetical protein V5799_015382 [Amblyomma americanum]|uniref:Secreted protein n=1 Tax=Amblyomma americanum TaxID=6943 RepID=A0AAQ4E0B3_AMBAM